MAGACLPHQSCLRLLLQLHPPHPCPPGYGRAFCVLRHLLRLAKVESWQRARLCAASAHV